MLSVRVVVVNGGGCGMRDRVDLLDGEKMQWVVVNCLLSFYDSLFPRSVGVL